MSEEMNAAVTEFYESDDDALLYIGERAVYIWNFQELTQERWHLSDEEENDVWKLVKIRAIRRVEILAAPMHPFSGADPAAPR